MLQVVSDSAQEPLSVNTHPASAEVVKTPTKQLGLSSFCASFALLLVVLGLSGGAWYLWERKGDAIIPAGRYILMVAALALIWINTLSVIRGRGLLKLADYLDLRAWSLGLVAITISDWIARPWGLFSGAHLRGEIILACVVAYTLLDRRRWVRLLSVWPIVSIALLLWSFYIAADGDLLFADDHAMFLFRLKLLKENFPSIPFWSPLWNGGIDARDFFATGALNAFLIASPIIYLTDIDKSYNLIISGLLWLLMPACVYAAARLLGYSRLAGAITTILALSCSLFWYRWGLKYGTVGFITSTALLPLVFALAIRQIHDQHPSRLITLALCVLTSLMLLWSPSGIAILPVALTALLLSPRAVFKKRQIVTLLVIVAINLPWMAMMWKVSKVSRFLNSHTTEVSVAQTPGQKGVTQTTIPAREPTTYRHKSGSIDTKKTLTHWQHNAIALNPLLLIFALPALLCVKAPLRRYFIATCGWLLLLGTVGVSLKPQLELDRMLVIAAVLLTIPVGDLLNRFFNQAERGTSWRLAASLACGFLILSTFISTSVVLNRSDDTYQFTTPEVRAIRSIISNHAGGGRALFTGCVLHELSGGHLAPLPMWSKTPMVASSYAHNIWRYEQPIPQSFLDRGDEGITDYMNLINASIVVAHEPTWIERFRSQPAKYEKLWRGDTFHIFKRIGYTPSYSLNGEVTNLSFNSNSVTLTPLSERVILKFKHFPFLTSSGCKITPYKVETGLELIELSACVPGQEITLKSVSPLTRLFSTNS